MDEDSIKEAWSRNGIVCKLVDFSESRSSVQLADAIYDRMTYNVDNSTIIFMVVDHISLHEDLRKVTSGHSL